MTTGKQPHTPIEGAQAVYAFFNEIGIIAQLSGNVFRRMLPKGMTMAQFGVLNHFSRLGGERTPARLAAAFQVTKGAMTNTLQRLHGKGYIDIKVDEADKRRKIVTITEAGVAIRNDTIAALALPMHQVAETLDMEELKAALPYLSKVRALLDDARTAEDFGDS